MTSLFVTHYRPHRPDAGSPLRNWQNIRALSSLGPVDVVTIGVDDPVEAVEGVRQWAPFSLRTRTPWDRVKAALAPIRPGVYPGVDLYRATPVTRWLSERRRRSHYDVAVLETIAVAGYLDDVRRMADRVVFDAHNVEGALQPALFAAEATPHRSMAAQMKQAVLCRRLSATERRIVSGADLVWTCSDADARHVGRLYGRRDGVHVVPNAVDVDKYQRSAQTGGEDFASATLTMVYPGVFTYPPNEQAALTLVREVLPAVRARVGSARVVLVGRNPTPALVDASHSDSDVIVTGAVASVLPYLEQPCVVTLPIATGGGTRLKILEAFAAGRPVVSTRIGAEGLDVADGEHLLLRDPVAAIADGVVDLWRHDARRRQLCAAASRLVRARYSFEAASELIAQSLSCTLTGAVPVAAPPRAAPLSHDVAS